MTESAEDEKVVSPDERYVRVQLLNRYTYKDEYFCIDRLRGSEVIWNEYHSCNVDEDRVSRELKILSALNHVNLISHLGNWVDDRNVAVCVTEKTSGTLAGLIANSRSSRFVIRSWCVQILLGINYLHERGIVHRDISLDNIFYAHDGRLKIGNLGLATILKDRTTSSIAETNYRYLAPEQLENSYNELVDIWAFGMCVLGIVSTSKPYGGIPEGVVLKMLAKGELPKDCIKIKNEGLLGFLLCCLAPQEERWSSEKLLSHSFLLSNPEEDRRLYFELREENEVEQILEEYGTAENYYTHIRSKQQENYHPDLVASYSSITGIPEDDEHSHASDHTDNSNDQHKHGSGPKSLNNSIHYINEKQIPIDTEQNIEPELKGNAKNEDGNPDTIEIKFSIALPQSGSSFGIELEYNLRNDTPLTMAKELIAQIDNLTDDHLENISSFIELKVNEYKQEHLVGTPKTQRLETELQKNLSSFQSNNT
eukprot:TRINITY_DN2463_c0_g1_i1.p1 TRINITY_DN2463_c0_g1~~TRINITY_DN2463_c0_g1_i1.p1  ORF type:complete len:502 (+),score=100.24 TRINITY_DN2463_c0_g1_i1:65-1507(+)